MKVEKLMKYEAPEVEVLKVEVELGFAASGIEGPGIGGDDGDFSGGDDQIKVVESRRTYIN